MDFLMGANQTSSCNAISTPKHADATPEHSRQGLEATQQKNDPELQWYAAYTYANHERRVAEQLAMRGVAHFLPQYESIRNWKDRKVKMQMPLFPGYLFVQITLTNRLSVLQVPGVARLVGFNGQAVAVPQEDINKVREFLCGGFRAEPHPFLRIGRRVRVANGPLAGMEGIVVRQKNRSRLVISFEMIQRAMAVDMEAVNLEPLVHALHPGVR